MAGLGAVCSMIGSLLVRTKDNVDELEGAGTHSRCASCHTPSTTHCALSSTLSTVLHNMGELEGAGTHYAMLNTKYHAALHYTTH